MSDNKHIIENRLKRAVEEATPDVLSNVLKQIETEQVVLTAKTAAASVTDYIVDESSEQITALPAQRPRSWVWFKAIVPVAAALMIALSFWLSLNYSTQAVVAFDVNPSIELSINRSEKILKVNPRNSEADAVIGDMVLKGIDLDVAVNALVGSMVQKGYLSEINNSILITVSSADQAKSEQMQNRLAGEIDSLLRSFSLDGAILSQVSTEYDYYAELAEQYGISPGKAALIEQLVQADPTITYDDASLLSINDLNILIEARRHQLAKVDISGHSSTKAFIGIERAKLIAFMNVGYSEAEVKDLKTDYGYVDGNLYYKIDFQINDLVFKYEIDAGTGDILKVESERELPSVTTSDDEDKAPKTTIASTATDTTAATTAKTTAKTTEVTAAATTAKTTDTTRHTPSPSPSTTLSPKATARQYIGAREAENIAFRHAGVNRSEVRDLDTEFERDDGKSYYEVEFEVGDTEYEYEIDAISGKILDYDIDD